MRFEPKKSNLLNSAKKIKTKKYEINHNFMLRIIEICIIFANSFCCYFTDVENFLLKNKCKIIKIYASTVTISETTKRGGGQHFKSKAVYVYTYVGFQFSCSSFFVLNLYKVKNVINLLIIVKWTTNKTQDFANRIRLL